MRWIGMLIFAGRLGDASSRDMHVLARKVL